jgi:hypothetical protein
MMSSMSLIDVPYKRGGLIAPNSILLFSSSHFRVCPKPTGYGPCRCPLNNKHFNLTQHAYKILSHIEHTHFIMGDEKSHKQKVERLESDGANWISYKSRLILTFKHRKWFDHLANATITQRYIDKGDVAGVMPPEQWENDKIAAMESIATTLLNVVWIPLMNTTVKAVWDTLVAEYKNRSQTSIIDLDHQMTSLRCGEDDNTRDHINQLVLMHERSSRYIAALEHWS